MLDRDTAGYAAAVQFLFAQRADGPKFGIDRMRVLADALGHPERLTPWIHVAGTNGKGSVAAMLDAILRAAGWRTGLYTSPHLVELGERVQVDRQSLSAQEVVAYTAELKPIADRIATANPDDRPSFFEFTTAMAWLQFARQQCDIGVLEVGLGGRLDATNVVRPEVTVITSIGMDHCELLGHTLEQIAAEKAGIVKPTMPLVIGRMPRAAEKIIRAVAAQQGAPVVSVAERFGDLMSNYPVTNLAGEYQRWNAATATLAAEALAPRWRVTPAAVAAGLAHVEWPGRWQSVQVDGRRLVLDASHNPEGAQVLGRNLAELVAQTGRAPIVIVGVLGTSRAGPLIEVIARHAAEIHFIVPAQPRACSYAELESLVPASFRGGTVRETIDHAFPRAEHCAIGGPDDMVVVTGSIYLLGEVMARLRLPQGGAS
jgi:dihydrofolate synthase / folylpolyglutamate synthase